MRRREFITRLAGASLAWPLAALAAGPMRLIGVLMGYGESDPLRSLSSRRSEVR